MLYSIKSREGLEKLNDFISVENQVKHLRLQDKVGKQNIYEEVKNI